MRYQNAVLNALITDHKESERKRERPIDLYDLFITLIFELASLVYSTLFLCLLASI